MYTPFSALSSNHMSTQINLYGVSFYPQTFNNMNMISFKLALVINISYSSFDNSIFFPAN